MHFVSSVQQAVKAGIDRNISCLAFRQRVTRALEEYPYALHPEASFRAATLVLGAYRAAGGSDQAGVVAAGAMEVLTTAAHLLDGVADGDSGYHATDLQVATALLFVMEDLLDEAIPAISSGAGYTNRRGIYSLMTEVCGGQQLDIDLQSENVPTLEVARAMTEQKTGAFGQALALVGAMAANAPADVQADLAEVGLYLGTWGQLIDDASDASTAAPNTSDISLRKKTVPLTFFLTSRGDRPDWDRLRDLFLARGLSQEDEISVRRAVEESGAVEFTLLLATWYRIKAEAIIHRLRGQGCDTVLLEQYLDQPGARSPQALEAVLA